MTIERQVARAFHLNGVECAPLHHFVNDVVAVRASGRRYALKLYRPGVRTVGEIRWEAGLTRHLAGHGVAVAAPVEGVDGFVHTFDVEGTQRFGMLFEWAAGAKPAPSTSTFELLGRAAASIHRAANSFRTDAPRADEDAAAMIDRPLGLMRSLLIRRGRWEDVAQLAGRLHRHLDGRHLDWGVCNRDLTLDNVHRDGDRMIVFDFDSAGATWRAVEGQGVYPRSSSRTDQGYWQAWMAGYRSVRALTSEDEAAVPWFVLINGLGETAWKLGLTPNTVGPLVRDEQIDTVVNGWLRWEADELGRAGGPMRKGREKPS